eukprot:TRINITY_DN1095_c0_g1_i1.p1 TRINITY_DN1095_c0_g1~~TRINITY_DN1095_c0_g1_i1.p1  ORF type:complete len:129 (-),score=24.85 TRINITY_DN1095_c0_g1_i1:24-410(-)
MSNFYRNLLDDTAQLARPNVVHLSKPTSQQTQKKEIKIYFSQTPELSEQKKPQEGKGSDVVSKDRERSRSRSKERAAIKAKEELPLSTAVKALAEPEVQLTREEKIKAAKERLMARKLNPVSDQQPPA